MRTTTKNKPYEATMYQFHYSTHATESAAKRALAKARKAYRDARHTMPYPAQQIRKDGKVIFSA